MYLFFIVLAIIIINYLPFLFVTGYKKKGELADVYFELKTVNSWLLLKYEMPEIQLWLKGITPQIKTAVEGEVGGKPVFGELSQLPLLRYLKQLQYWAGIFEYKLWWQRMLKRSIVERFIFRLRYGSNDAADTAMAVGYLYALVHSSLIPLQSLGFRVVPVVDIKPEYQKETLELDLECIVRLYLGDIILMTVSIGYFWLSEGVKRRWKVVRSRA